MAVVEDTSTNGSCTVRSQRNSETHTIYWRGASAQPAADHRRCARRPSPHVSRAVAKSPLGSMPCSESLRETPLGEPHDPPTHRGCAPLGLLPGNRPSPTPCLPILQPATESSRAGRMATILVMKRMVDSRDGKHLAGDGIRPGRAAQTSSCKGMKTMATRALCRALKCVGERAKTQACHRAWQPQLLTFAPLASRNVCDSGVAHAGGANRHMPQKCSSTVALHRGTLYM